MKFIKSGNDVILELNHAKINYKPVNLPVPSYSGEILNNLLIIALNFRTLEFKNIILLIVYNLC